MFLFEIKYILLLRNDQICPFVTIMLLGAMSERKENEWNENNYFVIFILFHCLRVLTEKWKYQSLFGSLSRGMKWIWKNTHFSIFSQNLKFSFSPKLGRIKGNKIRFNEFFTKTLKILLIHLAISFKIHCKKCIF